MGTASIFKPDILSGTTALVTGGASGICKGVAWELGRHGARVFIISRNEEKLAGAVKEFEAEGIQAAHAVADVRDYKQLEAAMEVCKQRFGGLDILVNGAAGNFLAPAAALSPNGFKTVVDIDLNGTFNACKAAFPLLQESKRASILNISATLHYGASPLMTHAVAAKAGVDALTRNLAVEWGGLGIRVNAVAPGPIEGTEGMARLAPGDLKRRITEKIPLKRWGEVEEIGYAAVYLSSAAAAYVNGHIMVVDGGAWLGGKLSMEEMAQM